MLKDPSGRNPNQFGAKDSKELIEIVRSSEAQLGKKLGRPPTRLETAKAFLEDQKRPVDGGVNHYYVFSATDSRWIDMRHFVSSALKGRIFRKQCFARAAIWMGGSVMEWWQDTLFAGRGNNASAAGVEDRYSNSLGACFGAEYLDGCEGAKCGFSDVLEEYLRNLGVSSKSKSRYLKALPDTEVQWGQWAVDGKLLSVIVREGAYVSRDRAAMIDSPLDLEDDYDPHEDEDDDWRDDAIIILP